MLLNATEAMLKLLFVILILVCLPSCALFRDVNTDAVTFPPLDNNTIADPGTTEAQTEPADTVEQTPPVTEEDTAPLPLCIGMYDELYGAGTYTRLDAWTSPMYVGTDIAVFDILLSSEVSLYGASYKELWKAEASKVTLYPESKPYLVLEYTLNDGTVRTWEIVTPSHAEDVIAEGYLEVYLYDDIHREDGEWYSHLTPADVNEDTVISSVKLTAGKSCDAVVSITLRACLEGSESATLTITR